MSIVGKLNVLRLIYPADDKLARHNKRRNYLGLDLNLSRAQ